MATKPRQLVRSRTNRVLAGVCSGIAAYFNLDATLVRVGFAVLAVIWGAGIFLYFLLWVIMPLEGKEEAAPSLGKRVRQTAEEIKDTAKQLKAEVTKK